MGVVDSVKRFTSLSLALLFATGVSFSQAARDSNSSRPADKKTPAADQDTNAAQANTAQPPLVMTEITVIATRESEEVKDVPQSVSVLNEEQVEKIHARNPVQMLSETPGVFTSQVASQGSPIVRGFNGNKVLYMWDGIRLNNGALFSGPNGFFNQIPEAAVGRMEIVRGPGAVQYGSDAIGGVINVITPRAEGFSQHFTYGGTLRGLYSSVDGERNNTGTFWFSTPRVNFSAGLTSQDVGNYATPRGIQRNVGFDANGGYFDSGFMLAPHQMLRTTFIQERRGNVATYTSSLLNLDGLPRNSDPWELRNIGKVDYDNDRFLANNNELRLYAYRQNYNQMREQLVDSLKATNRTRTLTNQEVYGGGTQDTLRWAHFRVVSGVDYRSEDLFSHKSLFALTKSANLTMTSVPNGNVPPGTYSAADAFAVATVSPIAKLTASVGLRYESDHLVSNPRPEDALTPFTVAALTLDKRWNAATWNAGAVYNVWGNWSLSGNVATAFRAPTFSDALSTSVPVFSSASATVPSPNIRPERSVTYEAGPRYVGHDLNASVSFYTTQLTDLLAGVPNGAIAIPGVGTVIALQNTNIGAGYVRGIEAYAAKRFMKNFVINGNLTYTRGMDTRNDVYLRFIPPTFGTIGFGYNAPSKRWWTMTSVTAVDRLRHHAPQDELDAGFSRDPGFGSPSLTNPAYRPGFQIPGYALLNQRIGYRVWQHGDKQSLELTADFNNVLNKSYREAYSQQELLAPGFGAAIGGRFSF